MKKAISLLLAMVLCFMLAACGSSGTGNEDYDYIISLLDRGEYDMAIQVIEMLRTGSAAVPPRQRARQRYPTARRKCRRRPAPTLPAVNIPLPAPAKPALTPR